MGARKSKTTNHVRVALLVHHSNVCELNVEELIHRVKCTPEAQVILKLHNHFSPNERLKKRVEQLE